MKVMDMKSNNISEPDYVGRFLLSLYHKRLFGNKGKVEKSAVRKEFQNYVKENPFPDIEKQKLETVLLKHTFISKARDTTKTNIFRIRMDNLRNYSKALLNRLDEAQKLEMFRRITVEYPSGNSKEAELEVDPTFQEEELTFETNYLDFIDKQFILTSKGCCICQENFSLEADYIEHIEYHTQDSDFESLRARRRSDSPYFRVSYQACKDSPLLRFCIESLDENLEIRKVVIVRETSMLYPQESTTPYSLSFKERNYFFIDCHTFEIGYEHPIVIIFKDCSCRDASIMYVEQHHFLRMDPFNVEMASVLNLYMPKRGELKSKGGVDDYLPPNDLNESDMTTIYRNCPKFLEYELGKKVIHAGNIEDIYKLLLQLEDIATLNVYKKLTQRETTVTKSGSNFSVSLRLNSDIKVEDILKEGDRVELFVRGNENVIRPVINNKGSGNPKIFGAVEQVLKKRIIFSIRNTKLVKPEKKYDVTFRPFRYYLQLQYRALELLKTRYDVKKMLFPMKKFYTNGKVRTSVSPYNENLAKNPEQLEAVERILHHMDTEAPYIIFGPPGTGKTTTIVEAIYQLWKDNPKNRILVVGGSNTCVDEIAIRLQKVFEETDPLGRNMLRIYSSAQGKKSDQLDENLIKVSNLCHGCQFYPSLEIVYMYNIVFATLSIAAKYIHAGLAENHFSHVFVDECGASTEPEVISALIGTVTMGTKVILAGDPKQLGPVLQSKTAEELGLGVSLLARLMNLNCYQTERGSKIYDRSRQMRLTKNFRTHPEILHMSNELYYDNDLEACGGTSVTSWALNWYNLPSPNFPIIFHSVKGKSKKLKGSQSLYNYSEIGVVMKYIKEMMYFGINGRQMEQSDIGVVTPYKSQVNFIRAELDERKWFEIEVGSVEKFQGQERPVIVFSTVRSQTESLGFLDSPKRLNVSLTRAQALLIIVGNPETLSASTDFNYVINYCKDNCAFKGESYADVISASITESLGNDFSNLSISKTNPNMQRKKQVQKAKQNKTIKTNPLKHEFKHKNQNKKAITTVQENPTLNNWIDDWLDLQKTCDRIDRILQAPVREHPKSTAKVPPTVNIHPVHHTSISIPNGNATKTNSVLNAGAARPSFQNLSSSNTKTVPKTDVSNKPANASTFNSISPTRSPSYARSFGETTKPVGVSSQPAQQKTSEVHVYPWQSTYAPSSTLRLDQRSNFSSHPIYPINRNISGSQAKLKKEKTCVIL